MRLGSKPHHHRHVAIPLLALGLTLGCAPVCDPVTAARAALDQRPAVAEPHLRLSVPLRWANARLDAELAQLEPIAVTPLALQLLAPDLAGLVIVAEDAELVPSDGAVRLELKASLRQRTSEGERHWLDLRSALELAPEVEGRTLRLSFSAEDVAEAELSLGDEARARLERAIADVLGEDVPEELIAQLGDLLLSYLSSEAFELLRDKVLHHLGELASFEVELPDVPLDHAEVESRSQPIPHLRVDGFTTLPVRRGLDDTPTAASSDIQLTLSTSTMAELANWGMDEGHLPARYNDDMEADPEGPLMPRLDWQPADPRPLKMHVFADEPECMRVLVGAKLGVRVVDGELSMAVSDGEVEHVDGSWRVKLGVWLDRLGEGPIAFTQRHLGRLSFEIAERPLTVSVRSAELTPERLTLLLDAE